jgi:hypothetical protein
MGWRILVLPVYPESEARDKIYQYPPTHVKTQRSWPWSYGSWIYYLCNQCLSPMMLWVRNLDQRCTKLCYTVCQWLATGRWFSLGPPVSSTNKTDRHDITEILLKMALNAIKQNPILVHSTNTVVYFDCKTLIYIYACGQCRTQFILPNSSRR